LGGSRAELAFARKLKNRFYSSAQKIVFAGEFCVA
jgi:hypothetical protein